MNTSRIINGLEIILKDEFANDATGHDWFHIDRVRKNALHIAKKEGGDLLVVELGALLHDIADHKFFENAEELAEKRIDELLNNAGVDHNIIQEVQHIVKYCSFKGGIGQNQMKSLEGKIVQDADRLDAIGAIGIARTFAFGGKFGNLIYDPGIQHATFESAEEYRSKRTHTINHFYEKLLLLKDLMNTETGKTLASARHQFMEDFLAHFYSEWEGQS